MRFPLIISSFIYLVNSIKSTDGQTLLSNNLIFIKEKFQHTSGAHLYFCRNRDAKAAMRFSLHSPNLFGNNLYNHQRNKLLVDIRNAPLCGVFVDLTCKNGISFLKQSTSLFNGSYEWLLWTDNKELTLENLKASRLMADSRVTLATTYGDGQISLYDVFRVNPSLPFTITEIGKLYKNKVVNFPIELPRRDDLQGAVLRGDVAIGGPQNFSACISKYIDKTYKPGNNIPQRSSVFSFLILAETLNTSYEYTFSEFWGYPRPDGSWTGVIGNLQRGITEIGLAASVYTTGRLHVVDFLQVLIKIRFKFIFKQAPNFGSKTSLIRPYTVTVWMLILSTGFIFMICISFIVKHDSIKHRNFAQNYFHFVSALAQQGVADISIRLSSRVVHLFLLFFTYFVFTYYSIALLYFLILPNPKAIQNIQQLLASDIELGFYDSPYFYYEFSWNDSISTQVREKVKNRRKEELFMPLLDGYRKVKKGGFAFYSSVYLMNYDFHNVFSDYEICSLTLIEKLRNGILGGVVSKNSPYREVFNRKIILMREVGVQDHIAKEWFLTSQECNWKLTSISLGFKPLFTVYFVMGLGVLASSAVLLMEVIQSKGITDRVTD